MLEHAPLEAAYIYFDAATYDEIERDEKVEKVSVRCDHIILILKFLGDNGSPIGFDRRHHGPSHRLLHPQWS